MDSNLYQYLKSNRDYSEISSIYEAVSRDLKSIHERGEYVPILNSTYISSVDFSFFESEPTDNVDLMKNNNRILAKLILGTYFSLTNEFLDFSNANWDENTIRNLCASITSDDFDALYFESVLCNDSDEYYCDFLDRKRQTEDLGSRSNTVAFKKVLSTAASALYDDQFENDVEVIEKKSAFVSVFYYPIIIGCSISIAYVIYSCIISLIN